MQHMYVMEYYSGLKEIRTYAKARMNLEDMLGKVSQTQ